jgi:hypothetical protein
MGDREMNWPCPEKAGCGSMPWNNFPMLGTALCHELLRCRRQNIKIALQQFTTSALDHGHITR